MEREGRRFEELTRDECWGLFDLIAAEGLAAPKTAREASVFDDGRHHSTTNKACKVATALYLLGPRPLTDDEARTIANEAGYETTPRYVHNMMSRLSVWWEQRHSDAPNLNTTRESPLLLWPPEPGPDAVYELVEAPGVALRTVQVRPIQPGGRLIKNFGSLEPGDARSAGASEAVGLRRDELGVLRIRAVDNVKIWITKADGEGHHAGVDIGTGAYSPDFASTQFWLWGSNVKERVVVKNPTSYPIAASRVAFWGWSIKVLSIERREVGSITLRQGWS